MSGVYIPNRKMPISCGDCVFKRFENGYGDYCVICPLPYENANDQIEHREVGRMEWCPLVPVPGHGDLIDRDKLEKDIENYIGGEESRSRFHHWVQVQSVVIPGDKEEEG